MVKTNNKKQKHNRKRGAAYTDSAVKILISVVVGALVLFGIIGLIANVVLPTTTSKVNSLFSVEGSSSGGSGGSGGGTGGDPAQYEMLEGDNAEYVLYQDENLLSFRASGDMNTFTKVMVDGEVVSADNYTVTSGSTIVTFNKQYSEQLATGTHSVEVCYPDGAAAANFSVVTPEAVSFTVKYENKYGVAAKTYSFTVPYGTTWAEWVQTTENTTNPKLGINNIVYSGGSSTPYNNAVSFVSTYNSKPLYGRLKYLTAYSRYLTIEEACKNLGELEANGERFQEGTHVIKPGEYTIIYHSDDDGGFDIGELI